LEGKGWVFGVRVNLTSDLQCHDSYGHDPYTLKRSRTINSKDRVETDGQTDGCKCFTSHANVVSKNY